MMTKYNIIPESSRVKRQFSFLIFCFFWFFLLHPLSRSTEIFYALAININYILLIFLPLWTYNTVFRKGFRYLPVKAKIVLKTVAIFVLIYLFLMALQLLINPHNSSLYSIRRTLAAAFPSFSLILLTAFYTIGSRERQLVMVRTLFTILVLMVFFSALGIGMDTAENTRQTYRVFREGGIVQQANNYGFFLTLLFILSAAGVANRIKIFPNRIVYIPILFFTFLFIIRSGSYGAIILSFLCSTPLIIKRSSIENILGTYVIVPVFIIVLWVGINTVSGEKQNYKVEAFITLFSEKSMASAYEASTFLLRYEIIIDGIQRIINQPILGHGLSDRSAYSVSRMKNIAVHNAFIGASLKAGISAGIVMLLLYWTIMKYSLRIKKRNTMTVVYSLLLFMFIGDNTLTAFSFLTLTSGVIAFSLVLMYLINDLISKPVSVVPSRSF